MSLFSSKPEPVHASNGASALSQERLVELFKAQKWSYFIDSDGDFGSFFDDLRYFFILRGQQQEILYGRAELPPQFEMQDLETIREVIEKWHERKAFPRVHYQISDSGSIRVVTEYTVDYEEGVSDDQLLTHVQLFVSTTSSLQDALREALDKE